MGYIDISKLTLDELVGVVNLYPWFGGARMELCERMRRIGGDGLSENQYAEAAMYVASRTKMADMVRSSVSQDWTDADVEKLLKSFLSEEETSEEAPAAEEIPEEEVLEEVPAEEIVAMQMNFGVPAFAGESEEVVVSANDVNLEDVLFTSTKEIDKTSLLTAESEAIAEATEKVWKLTMLEERFCGVNVAENICNGAFENQIKYTRNEKYVLLWS